LRLTCNIFKDHTLHLSYISSWTVSVGNRPNHGFRRHLEAKRSEITVSVWESDGK